MNFWCSSQHTLRDQVVVLKLPPWGCIWEVKSSLCIAKFLPALVCPQSTRGTMPLMLQFLTVWGLHCVSTSFFLGLRLRLVKRLLYVRRPRLPLHLRLLTVALRRRRRTGLRGLRRRRRLHLRRRRGHQRRRRCHHHRQAMAHRPLPGSRCGCPSVRGEPAGPSVAAGAAEGDHPPAGAPEEQNVQPG